MRYKAAEGASFASENTEVEIASFKLVREETPKAEIDFENEVLTGFVSGAVYTFGGTRVTLTGDTYPIDGT